MAPLHNGFAVRRGRWRRGRASPQLMLAAAVHDTTRHKVQCRCWEAATTRHYPYKQYKQYTASLHRHTIPVGREGEGH